MIQQCKCGSRPHVQDELHGTGNRVFNEIPLKTGGTELRCTVCGATMRGHTQVDQKLEKAKKKKEKALTA